MHQNNCNKEWYVRGKERERERENEKERERERGRERGKENERDDFLLRSLFAS